MRHANLDDLKGIEGLLNEIRTSKCLIEKKPGVFYYRSRAFLHFHEHQGEIFADLRLADPRFGGTDFDRYPVTTQSEQAQLLTLIQSVETTVRATKK